MKPKRVRRITNEGQYVAVVYWMVPLNWFFLCLDNGKSASEKTHARVYTHKRTHSIVQRPELMFNLIEKCVFIAFWPCALPTLTHWVSNVYGSTFTAALILYCFRLNRHPVFSRFDSLPKSRLHLLEISMCVGKQKLTQASFIQPQCENRNYTGMR